MGCTLQGLELEYTQGSKSVLFSKDKVSEKSILDIGTGDGQFVEDLIVLGAHAVGIDLVLKNKMKEKSYFIEADAKHLPFPNNKFDQIYSN